MRLIHVCQIQIEYSEGMIMQLPLFAVWGLTPIDKDLNISLQFLESLPIYSITIFR